MSFIAERRSPISSSADDWYGVAQLANKAKLPYETGPHLEIFNYIISPEEYFPWDIEEEQVDCTFLSIFQIPDDLRQAVFVLRAGIVPFVETRCNDFRIVLNILNCLQPFIDQSADFDFIQEIVVVVVQILIENLYQDFEEGILRMTLKLRLAASSKEL